MREPRVVFMMCLVAMMGPIVSEDSRRFTQQVWGGRKALGMRGHRGTPLRMPSNIHERLVLRGGCGVSPDVGMENWASDYERRYWNESNPSIRSPMFVPKGNWTEEDFDRARKDPAFQDKTSQLLIEREYRRLKGLPQTFDPSVEDPWDGMRGEGGASYWGDDPLENIPGGTAGLKEEPALRKMLQYLLLQIRARNESGPAMVDPCKPTTYSEAIYLVTCLEALRQLKVCDLGCEARLLFPLREDEWLGPQVLSLLALLVQTYKWCHRRNCRCSVYLPH